MSRSSSFNRYSRRSAVIATKRRRSIHFHVGESVFRTHQDATQHARIIAGELRGSAEPGSFLGYVVSVADAVEEMTRIESCNLDCEL